MTASRQALAPALEAAPEVAPASVPEIGAEAKDVPASRAYLAVRLLWDRRRFVAAVALRGMALSLLLAFLIPANYESKTALMPPDPHSAAAGMLAALGTGAGSGGALSVGADLLGLRTSGALFISILTSDTVRDALINRFDLRQVYSLRTYRAARRKLDERTSIQEERKSGVITIVVTDHNPQRAAALARAYVEELDRMVVDLNTSAAHRERVFLEDRLKAVKLELDQSAREFSEFSSKTAAIDIKEQGRALVTAAATLQGQLIAAESELRGLEQIYTSNNVRVRSLRARVAELQRQLEKLGGTSSGPAPEAANGGSAYPSIRQLPVLGVTYADLFRRVTINETVYEVLTKEYELARVQEVKEVPSVKVIDVAQPAEKRSGPPRLLIVVGGGALACTFSAVWLLGKEAWAQSDPQDPRKLLAEEMAGAIVQRIPWKLEISGNGGPGRFRLRFRRNPNRFE